jgi:hypothetical protein
MSATSVYRQIRSRAADLLFTARILFRPTQRRHAWRFLRSRSKDYLLHSDSPWITFDAIDYLEQFMTPDYRVFEYGSGGSTLFWLRWTRNVVSVEHDAIWYQMMQKRLGENSPVDYRLIIPGELTGLPHPDPADPSHYASDDPPWRGLSFREYVCQIDGFRDASFDVVLIDGRARTSCADHAASKVRSGGLLIVDDAERVYYLTGAAEQLAGFVRHRFTGCRPVNKWFSSTDIYVRK